VHCTAVPAGQDLLSWSADRIVQRLDRGNPMWRVDVVPLPDGEFALLFVAHHVLADGRTGAAILRRLLDAPAGASVSFEPPPSTRPPSPAAARRSRWRRLRDAVGDLRRRAPRTSLYRTVGLHRRLAVVTADLADLRAAETATGATVNDVLLAAVTAGLRAFLASRGDPVDRLTLRASMPVSSGAAGQPEGMLLVSLPVNEPSGRRRLAAITASTTALKGRLREGGGNVFDVLHLPTPLARAAVLSMRRIARHSVNLFVTNVPGPTVPLSLAGARLLAAVPVAPLAGEVPLGIAALSYAGRLQVAINADAGIGDLSVLRDAMTTEFAVLAAMARTGAPSWGTPETHLRR
jgi:WS/DGAT/MGAT family acyltransferase